MASKVTEIYNNVPDAKTWYSNGILEKYRDIESQVFHKWNTCFNTFEPKQSNSNTAKILENETIKYSDFIEELGRSVICIDDCRSALTNKHKYRVIYTDNDTYLTKDPSFEPTEEETGMSLFSF